MRIIAGEFGGRRLKAPKGRGTRPTPDRVREALFSVLGETVHGARVVELFGGTGSLALEALSRGAAEAVFFETARPAQACLLDNIHALGVLDRCTVHRRSAFDLPRLAGRTKAFDLVFCDPPFRLLEAPESRSRLLDLLGAVPLAPGGVVILEHRAGTLGSFLPPRLSLEQIRRWGSTGMAFFVEASVEPPEDGFA